MLFWNVWLCGMTFDHLLFNISQKCKLIEVHVNINMVWPWHGKEAPTISIKLTRVIKIVVTTTFNILILWYYYEIVPIYIGDHYSTTCILVTVLWLPLALYIHCVLIVNLHPVQTMLLLHGKLSIIVAFTMS